MYAGRKEFKLTPLNWNKKKLIQPKNKCKKKSENKKHETNFTGLLENINKKF